jgi:hypothetical protein
LRLWLEAMWQSTSQKYGAKALRLQRVLNLRSYHTAWKWLYKLRRAMVRPHHDKLYGTVDVDETYIGGTRSGKRGFGAENKALVVIAVEGKSRDEDSKGIGRIRIKRVPDASSESLNGFISKHVSPGAHVRAEGWSGHEPLNKTGYEHNVVGSKVQGSQYCTPGGRSLKTLAFEHLPGGCKPNSVRLLLG